MSLKHLSVDRSQNDDPSFPVDTRHDIANLVNLRLETGTEQHRNSRLRNYFLGYREFMEAPPSPSPSVSEDEFPEASPFEHIEKLNKRSISSARFRPPQRKTVRDKTVRSRGESLSPISPNAEMFLSSRTYGLSHRTTNRKRAPSLSPPHSRQFYNSAKRTSSFRSSRFQVRSKSRPGRVLKRRSSSTHQMSLRSKDGS